MSSGKMRSLSEIAREIRDDWRKVYFGAEPYLEAMESLDSVDQKYGADDGTSIVIHFLSNCQAWRGEKARAIKAELNRMVKNR